MIGSASEPATGASAYVVERFDPIQHDTTRFGCGKRELDSYITETFERDEADRTAVSYVLIDRAEPGPIRRVIGYLTLNSYAFPKRQGRRRDQDRSLGAYGLVPALLIGRLALDAAFQGRGLGSVLIFEALRLALIISQRAGVAGVVVHALDEDAARFYEHQGFTRFRDEPHQLYYPLKAYIQALPERDRGKE